MKSLLELVGDLLLAAQSLTGYGAPAQLPEIVLVPQATLQEIACERPCKVLGWFPPGKTIYLDDRLDPRADKRAAGILLHELVHYLQQEAGAYSDLGACRKWAVREHEAYRIQARWLARQGTTARLYNGVGRPPWRLPCNDSAELPGNAAEAVPE